MYHKIKLSRQDKKIAKLEHRTEKYVRKRDKAREKIPTIEKKVKVRIYDEGKNKAKTKLRFEEETVPINEAKWNQPKKRSLPAKGAIAARTMVANKIHTKIYEVERENVGTQAAHRGELIGESAYRGGKKLIHSTYRFVKNGPYRRAAKFEAKAIKTRMRLDYQKAIRDNPKLKSNVLSRYMQKRKIKQQYAAAYRKAKQSGKTIKKTGSVMAKTNKLLTNIIRRNPILMFKMGILLLLMFAVMSLFTLCGSMLSNSTSFIGGVSYAAEDVDIDSAELLYTGMETDLQIEIANAERTHRGYDEYRYNIGNIGHDPFEMMAFLTAVYEDFIYADIEPILHEIFAEQYRLEYISSIEIRYRTETRRASYRDADGNRHTYTYTVEVPYDWHILTVTLTTNPFTQIIYPRMDDDQRQHFEILMMTKGARQYVGNPFDFNWLPYVSSLYGYRIHPITGVRDYHKGIDIALPIGTEIRSGLDGMVVQVGYDAGGYGNYVVIENNKGLQTKYAHCRSISVTAGQTANKGDIIATVGNTGSSTGPHLHIEVVKNGQHLNPIYFVKTGDDGRGRIPPGTPGGIVIPPYSGEPMGDGSFAALLAEAEKYIGYPYVWSGSHPSTSFDCSGYIYWIFNQSGAASFGRTTAQGLFNLCTPVSLANAEPGDLLFFHSTYSSPNPITHVALYLGNNLFLHAGDPIGYGSLNSSYWQNHYYAAGRLNS